MGKIVILILFSLCFLHTLYTNQDHQSFGWSVKETTNRNGEFGDTDLMNSMDLSMIFRPLYHKEALLAFLHVRRELILKGEFQLQLLSRVVN